MKKNIFQKMLASMVALAALLVAGSALAHKCQPRDFVGSCGISTEADVQIALDSAEVAKPDGQVIEQMFLQVTMNAWHPEFGCTVFNSWPFWTDEQKQKVITRMHEQGIISSEQVENWQKSPYPPCVEQRQNR